MKKNWREAATLIVIARDVSKNLKFDYKVLTFKRTEKTSFMPNNICFPGGAIDKSDESKDWIAFLKKYKVPFEELLPKPGTKKAVYLWSPRWISGSWDIFENHGDPRDIRGSRNCFLVPARCPHITVFQLLSYKGLRYPFVAEENPQSTRFDDGILWKA